MLTRGRFAMLKAKQVEAIAHIAAGRTREQAADLVGVHVATVARWLTLPEIKAELATMRQRHRDAVHTQAVVAGIEAGDALRRARERITEALPRGVEVVIGILMDDGAEPRDRLQAFRLLAERGGLPAGLVVSNSDELERMPLERLEERVIELVEERRGVRPAELPPGSLDEGTE